MTTQAAVEVPPRLAALVARHPPEAIARPGHERELGELLEAATGGQVALWPMGSGDHARLPPRIERRWSLLDLRGLDTVRGIDRRSAVAHVAAGCTVGRLEAALADAGLTLGGACADVAPQATVGGLVARHWPYPAPFAQPTLRSACIGLSALFGAGARYHYLPAPRKASGPDLRHFFLGGEGRHGVVTELWIAAQRAPAHDVQLSLRATDWPQAIGAVQTMLRGGARPWRCVLSGLGAGAGVRVELRLAGHEPLVALWQREALGLLEAVEPSAQHHTAAASARLELGGAWASIARALELLDGDDGVTVREATAWGGRLELARALAPPEREAVLGLPWLAVVEHEGAACPSDGLVARLSESLDPAGLWLAANFSRSR